ncbi:MAG: hypothetical protein ACRDDH_11910 [Cetobacterium sp.]|uniref:hypothetical protein n=1 Tax=Cetobacterium sp. TaxID=2071632 RepID=UPI003EE62F70
MEKFLEFKREMKLEKSGFEDPMQDWEIDFYIERGKAFGLDKEGMKLLYDFIAEIQWR